MFCEFFSRDKTVRTMLVQNNVGLDLKWF